ncbi:hypothetical protein [Paenibacillus wynnii]|uniref:hypothetical protein n=1 Tax=Paenibacillus wynnii TaxID=268407 RepID=UPI000ABF162F|nr:hypothetical protein [Paenibacillus wynnii]
MNKKKIWSGVVSGFLAVSLFASPVLASTGPVTEIQEINVADRTLPLGQDEFSARVLSSVIDMTPYITVDALGVYHIDSAAKDVVALDIYNQYLKGVEALNNLSVNGSVATTSKGEMSTLVFSNSYWWGVAITFNNTETKNMVYSLQQTASVATLLAGIAAFIPVAWLGSVVALIEATGATMIANSMSYHNEGKGVTLNIHWLPVPYFESTTNG